MNRAERIAACVEAANAYRTFGGLQPLTETPPTELEAYALVNVAIETLGRHLLDLYGHRAAAIEENDVSRAAGGRVLLYWGGLYALGGTSDVMQPLQNAPLAFRLSAPALLDDLFVQLQDEE